MFAWLKVLFTSDPVLTYPDPTQQFIVEVDALDVGVGAVLSQRGSEHQRLHLWTFFSCHVTPAEELRPSE